MLLTKEMDVPDENRWPPVGTVCKPRQCAGCMACVDICPKAAITVTDSVDHMDAIIDAKKCINCGLCYRVCQNNYPPELKSTRESWQGWADSKTRGGSSSGGFAAAIEKAFVSAGGTVCTCKLESGKFCFVLARNLDQLKGFAGSKYVKSNPEGAYRAVTEELKAGRRVLFLGLPCQVAAMRNFVDMRCRGKIGDLYTIDLICHGTPSVQVLQMALREYGYDLGSAKYIWFRRNSDFGLLTDVNRIVPEGCTDRYTMAFLEGVCYTENCYSCRYATPKRTSDLTLGDSWGTDLRSEEPKGISLALIQTDRGRELLNMAALELRHVDYENALAVNTQLRRPTEKTLDHDLFFSQLDKTESVKKAVLAIWPKRCFKQDVKAVLIKMGLWKLRGGAPIICNRN